MKFLRKQRGLKVKKKQDVKLKSGIQVPMTMNHSFQVLARFFRFVTLIEALSIDWTESIWSCEDYIALESSKLMGDPDYCIG